MDETFSSLFFFITTGDEHLWTVEYNKFEGFLSWINKGKEQRWLPMATHAGGEFGRDEYCNLILGLK